MLDPDYKRPFDQDDFRGYFTWTQELTTKLVGDNLYHACHKKELRKILKEGKLELRSKLFLKLPLGDRSVPGTWTCLNDFCNDNYYGPFLLNFPLQVLNNRHFMIFRRKGKDRTRYFFVQYETKIPVYRYEKKIWRNIKPEGYFKKYRGEELIRKSGAIYNIIITQPMTLEGVSIDAVKHSRCSSGVCSGIDRKQSKERLAEIAKGEFCNWLSKSEEYRNLLRRFQILDREKIELFDPESND